MCCMSKVTFHLSVTPKATDAPNDNYPTGIDLVNQNNSKRKFSPNPSEREKKIIISDSLSFFVSYAWVTFLREIKQTQKKALKYPWLPFVYLLVPWK